MDKNLDIKNSGILLKFFNKETDQVENKLIIDWINDSPENKRYFEEVKFLWKEENSNLFNNKYNPESAWNNIEPKLKIFKVADSKSNSIIKSSKKSFLYYFSRIAAILVLIFGIWQIINISQLNKEIIITSGGKTITHNLADGSTVWLNKNTSIKYLKRFGKDSRTLYLSGEAYFEVKPNNELPFIIYAKNAKIEVTGTSFNINAMDNLDEVEVIVSSGTVNVSKEISEPELKNDSESGITDNKSVTDDVSIELTTGERAVVNDIIPIIEKSQNSDLNYIAWKTRVLVFDRTKMEEVTKEIEEIYNVSILFENKELRNCILVAKFEDQSLDNILEIIKYTFNIEYEKDDNTILLKGQGCK